MVKYVIAGVAGSAILSGAWVGATWSGAPSTGPAQTPYRPAAIEDRIPGTPRFCLDWTAGFEDPLSLGAPNCGPSEPEPALQGPVDMRPMPQDRLDM